MSSNEKIVVFGPALPLNIAPMWVAYDKGFFKEEGLDVDLRPVQGIPDSEHPRHQWRKEGSIIFQSPGGSPPFRSVLEKRDHIDGEVNVVSIANRTAHVFVAKPYVKDVADLKGKKDRRRPQRRVEHGRQDGHAPLRRRSGKGCYVDR